MRLSGWFASALAVAVIGILLAGFGDARGAGGAAFGRDPLRALERPQGFPQYGEIYAMNADGSNAVRLTDNQADDSMPAWSPDGTKIAFTRYEGASSGEIWVMEADGSNQVNLTNDPADDQSPAWSPDGTRIAFSRYGDNGTDVYVMNADGSNQVNLTSGSLAGGEPAWSPDGTKIAFTSVSDSDLEIYVMDSDGGNPMDITNDPASIDYRP